MSETCTCLNGDMWRCIDGRVYGPCSSEQCGGVCEYDGGCPCSLHQTDPDHRPTR